ncbi:hypothetical protein RQP46_007742 [Phenoliferia psychrophenolica]
MTSSTPKASIDLYNSSMANVKAAVPAIAHSIDRAGSGFGRAFTIAAAKHGAKVFISDLSVASAQETATLAGKGAEVTVYSESCDVSSWEAQLLILGMFYLRENHKAKGRAMVFLGSLASISGLPSGPMYGAAKHGVLGLFRSVYYNGLADGINMNIICPWFVDTKIIAPLTRIGLFGLPLAAIEDVVGGMLRSASDPDFNGNTVVIDAEGILAIPFDQFSAGESGYFAEFEKRAATSITTERKIKDLGLILRQVSYYWAALFSTLLFGFFVKAKSTKKA